MTAAIWFRLIAIIGGMLTPFAGMWIAATRGYNQ
jgi:hypothetical protein